MSRPDPKLDPRRAESLFRELLARARTWIPDWQPTGSQSDFGHALLKIAARLSAEVTERLDRTPGKSALGLLDWLAIERRAGHAARMPVVFRMASGTTDPVLAPERVRVQANIGETPIAFETQHEVQLVPTPIRQIVAVDPDRDAIYLPPLSVLSLDPPESGPVEWIVKSLVTGGDRNNKLQLSPSLGVRKETILKVERPRQIDSLEYRVVADPDGDIVTVEPAIGHLDPGSNATSAATGDIEEHTPVTEVRSFIPFDSSSRNRQEHALYIGDEDALNLTAQACIAVVGSVDLPDDLTWEYWGKQGDNEPGWRKLDRGSKGTNLFFPKDDEGSIENYEIDRKTSRWIRATRTPGIKERVSFTDLLLQINPRSKDSAGSVAAKDLPPDSKPPKLEGVANNTSLVLNERFYPFGRTPRQFDSFFLACPEVFSKKDAEVTITLDIADLTLGRLAYSSTTQRLYGVSRDGSLHRYEFIGEQKEPTHLVGFERPTATAESGAGSGADRAPVFQGAEPEITPVVVEGTESDCRVFVASRRNVWMFTEKVVSGEWTYSWTYFGTVGGDDSRAEAIKIGGLLCVQGQGGQPTLIAVVAGALYSSTVTPTTNPSWEAIEPAAEVAWKRIAPTIKHEEGRRTPADSFVALGEAGNGAQLAIFKLGDGTWNKTEITNGVESWDTDFTPLAVSTSPGDTVFLVGKTKANRKLQALLHPPAEQDGKKPGTVDPKGSIIGSSCDFVVNEFGKIYVVFLRRPSSTEDRRLPQLAWWAPVDGSELAAGGTLVDANGTGATVREGPTVADSRIVVPGVRLDLWCTTVTEMPSKIQTLELKSLQQGILTEKVIPAKKYVLEFHGADAATGENQYFAVLPSIPAYAGERHNPMSLTDPPLASATLGDTSRLYPWPLNNHRRLTYTRVPIPNQLQIDTTELEGPEKLTLVLEYADGPGSSEYFEHAIKEVNEVGLVTLETELSADENVTVFPCQACCDLGGKRVFSPNQLRFPDDVTLPGLRSLLVLENTNVGGVSYSRSLVDAVDDEKRIVTLSPSLPHTDPDQPFRCQLHKPLRLDSIVSNAELKFSEIPDGLRVDSSLLLEYPSAGTFAYHQCKVTNIDAVNKNVTFDPTLQAGPPAADIAVLLYQPFAGTLVFSERSLALDTLNFDLVKEGRVLLLGAQLPYHRNQVKAVDHATKIVSLQGNLDLPDENDAVKLKLELAPSLPAGRVYSKNQLRLGEGIPPRLKERSVLLFKKNAHEELPHSSRVISNVDKPNKIITVQLDLPLDNNVKWVVFWIDENQVVQGDLRPVLSLRPDEGFDDPTMSLLRKTRIVYFGSKVADPRQQTVDTIHEAESKEKFAVLKDPWRMPPAATSAKRFEITVAVESYKPELWSPYRFDWSSNPELSWEYWRGAGWWAIKDLKDFTANLKANLKPGDKRVGTIEFKVPTDIQPTDVLGRQSYWIRARLVGGDYGRETFVTTTTPPPPPAPSTQSKQSVVINTDNIRAPIVRSISIAYSNDKAVAPRFLLTFDSRSWRDQSDANRTPGASVDAFIPVDECLPQLSGAAGPGTQGSGNSLGPRGGSAQQPTPAQGSAPASPDEHPLTGSGSRGIYLVFDKEIKGSPIRLLFLLADREHDESAPMIVEALRNNRFESVVAEDKTRALGESGVLTLSLDSPPSRAELFGITGFWLRLRPSTGLASTRWSPSIRGAYVNAVWAEATETQEMEILGSSDGSPAQRVLLARPPVLSDSLELRVREPLGDEEMQDLTEGDKTVVKDHVTGLPGRWVLWREAVDPEDAGRGDRVYALDSASGEIRFGDGIHGAIPPIGRDAVVAFGYRHGGAAAANDVPPFTPLNLVTPIDGVEAAITPDSAAGGADAEAPATVLRFASARLRHRDRAITLKDLEDLTLDYLPDIVQARAFTSTQGTRLLVVMRGGESGPQPGAQERTPRASPRTCEFIAGETRGAAH